MLFRQQAQRCKGVALARVDDGAIVEEETMAMKGSKSVIRTRQDASVTAVCNCQNVSVG